MAWLLLRASTDIPVLSDLSRTFSLEAGKSVARPQDATLQKISFSSSCASTRARAHAHGHPYPSIPFSLEPNNRSAPLLFPLSRLFCPVCGINYAASGRPNCFWAVLPSGQNGKSGGPRHFRLSSSRFFRARDICCDQSVNAAIPTKFGRGRRRRYDASRGWATFPVAGLTDPTEAAIIILGGGKW